MKVCIRKTTYDSETGALKPGMVVDVNKTTGERWVKYRIADEVVPDVKLADPKPVEPKQIEEVSVGLVEILGDPEVEPGVIDLESMTKGEIRALAERNGINNLPIKANKAEMLKRLSGVELK